MSISNSFNSKKIRNIDGKFLTTKQDQSIHGIGLNSVNMALEKYDGCMKINHDNSSFEVEIMIPLKSSTK